jgi:hypothetical protein
MPTSIEHKLTTIISMLLDSKDAEQADRLQTEKNHQETLLAIADVKSSILLMQKDIETIKQILGVNDAVSFKVTLGPVVQQ